ncbi:TRAP transporter substrate-binding protein DctP [Mesobacillus harenae]|uniref:TRAP transporter substrate-binding protein n=1 Tax=Mesobacillus harenae TaxID=2213203 RepID=UPI00157FD4C2|nr:TRAP transporter substrate-binding protein DctP [Mesobacillus harenae]
MNYKKILMGVLMLLIALIISGCGSNEVSNDTNGGETPSNKDESKDTITLKFASASPANAPYTVGAMEPFMERVTELTNNQVQFEFYPAEQLGKAADLLDLVKNGATDIAYYGSPFYPSKMPIGSSMVGIPYLSKTSHQGSMALHELVKQSPMLEVDFLNNGVRPVITSVTRPYDFFTGGKEIRTPDDLKGKKVRSSGGISNFTFELLGATPVAVNTPDMYEAFDQGIIEVLHMFPSTLNSYGVDELIGYGTQGANFGASAVGFVINEEVYQGLPKNVQEAIIQAGDEIVDNYSAYGDEDNSNIIEEWKKADMNLVELTEAEQEAWRNAAAKVEEAWLDKQDNRELIQTLEKYKELLKKYEK